MGAEDTSPVVIAPPGRWDHLVGELQGLRERRGAVAYSEIARRIQARRMDAGQGEHAARVARSTVHFTFQRGRARINIDLVREIVEALGEDTALVDQWLAEPERPPRPGQDPEEPDAPVGGAAPAPRTHVAALLLACLTLNLVGREFVDFFRLPIYLDMAGTAIAAMALGPWRGAAVGAATNVVGIVGSGLISLPFALVNITGALVWGYGVRRWGMGRTLLRFFALNVGTALACSLVAVPVIVVFLGDRLRAGHDAITQIVEESIDTFVLAVGFSNVLTSVSDKLVAGFFALALISALPASLRLGADLVGVENGQAARDSR